MPDPYFWDFFGSLLKILSWKCLQITSCLPLLSNMLQLLKFNSDRWKQRALDFKITESTLELLVIEIGPFIYLLGWLYFAFLFLFLFCFCYSLWARRKRSPSTSDFWLWVSYLTSLVLCQMGLCRYAHCITWVWGRYFTISNRNIMNIIIIVWKFLHRLVILLRQANFTDFLPEALFLANVTDFTD